VAVVFMAAALNDGCLPPLTETEVEAALSRFGANLRRARLGADLSQEALAFEAGMHRTALSRLETCERAPEFRTLLRLSRALRVTPASLLRGIR
jgi:ribosome-binding protein aMBF1 (putative translation factor)